MSRTQLLAILAGVIGSILGGLSFLFLKNVVSVAPPLNILAYRFTIAFIVMSLLILFRIVKVHYGGKPVLPLIIFSIFQPVLAFSFQIYGMNYTTASEAGIITAIYPIIVLVLAALLLKERTSFVQKLSIFISVGGVVFIGWMSGVEGEGSLIGMTLIFLSAVFMALFTVFARKYSKQFTPMEMTYAMMFVGMVMFNILLFASQEQVNVEILYSLDFILPILYLSIPASLLTAFLINYAISQLSASQTGVFMNLATIVGVLSGVMILHEPFYIYHMIGTVLIIMGVIGVNLQFKPKELVKNENKEEKVYGYQNIFRKN
ncbi:DMT family transporter [Bacillus spongiae]|uniref:DMT family transporter n=1 Tax=Bacillus spongiae TaxID=2683610 RepID=A0ABU8HBD4_9BACI